ncbi:MAG: BrnT family toxin [Anaerolinea sp.]|nr:BrnT family toxin [Anaerolinea sp.]HRI56055.1 BrnT family toxin [Anaerolineae bacterium]
MSDFRFVWDSAKAAQNQRNHGVSFEEARSVFFDENARFESDPDHSVDEDRFLLLGMSYAFRILLVVHCYREEDHMIRLISARKATKTERRQYEEFLK